MNCWNVYEYLKDCHRNGKKVSREFVYAVFAHNTPRKVIEEGIAEFELMLRREGNEPQLARSNAGAAV